jgi:sec-independent protein translocase protein TatA
MASGPRAEDWAMGFLTEPTHLIIIAIILLVLFGGKKLPELGKGLGEGLKGFREGIKGVSDPVPAAPTVQQTAASAPPFVSTPAESALKKEDMEFVTCSRCGNRFENPMGFKVSDYVCRSCQKSS